MKKLRKFWRKLSSWLNGQPEQPKLYRANLRFKKRYPDYEIGFGTYGVPEVCDWNQGTSLSIGNYCSIANNVSIYLGGNHRTDWVTSYPFPAYLPQAKHISGCGQTHGDVRIGSDVWLCNDCTILSGVSIGHGAVIGSGAVVGRDVEPYAIMVGNPAQRIRWRFDEPIRQALLDTAWWDWPVEEIRSVVDKLCSENINEFITYARQRNNL